MHHEKGDGPASSSGTSETKTMNDSLQETSDTGTGGMVFHPVVRGPPRAKSESSREIPVMSVVSPTHVTGSSSSSPLDSLSGGESTDSETVTTPANARSTTARRVVRKHRRSSKEKKKVFENMTVTGDEHSSNGSRSDGFSPTPVPPQQPPAQSAYTSSDSSSEGKSAPPHFSPPRSRRRRKLPPGNSLGMLNGNAQPNSGPKIVGILKKSHRSSAKSNGNGKEEDNKVDCGTIVSATPSRTCSAVSGAPMLEQQRGEGGDDYGGLLDESQVSHDAIVMSSASTSKRVRFSDNLEGSFNSSQTSAYTNPHPASGVNIDSAVELWKCVLPSSMYGRSPPNGMFSPKMKISLSQRGQSGSQKLKSQTSDRITVHVPQASEYLSGPLRVEEENSAATARDAWLKGDSGMELARSGDCSVQQNSTNKRYGARYTASQGQDDSRNDGRALHLNQSPTDAQIDGVWDEIQMQLYGTGDKATLAPQVYRFQPDSQRGKISTQGGKVEHSSQTYRYNNGK